MTTTAPTAWMRGRPGSLAWALWALAMVGIPVVVWLDHLLHQAGRADLSSLSNSSIAMVALVSAATVVAAILVGAALAAVLPALPAVSEQSPAVPAEGGTAQFRVGSGSWDYAPSLPEGWGWMGGFIDAGGVQQQVLASTGSSGTTPFSSIFLNW